MKNQKKLPNRTKFDELKLISTLTICKAPKKHIGNSYRQYVVCLGLNKAKEKNDGREYYCKWGKYCCQPISAILFHSAFAKPKGKQPENTKFAHATNFFCFACTLSVQPH